MHSVGLRTFLCLLAGSAIAGEKEFARAVRIEAAGAPIDVGGFRGAAPFVGDFDGDGLNDLLVGQYESGRLRIYRNQGTKKEPRFDDFDWFRVNGEIVELPGGGLFRPQLGDLDGDGKPDIVAPSESGMILWYRRTGATEFADPELLRLSNGQILIAGTFAVCHIADWDGDGDNDLIVLGQPAPDAQTAEISFIENRGAVGSLSLAAPTRLESDGQPIRLPQMGACPFVVDWNRDGKLDLLLGMPNGAVVLYENSGEKGAPRLAKERVLVEAPRQDGQPPAEDSLHRGHGCNLCVADWDNDGLLDILIGDMQSETIRPDVSAMAEELEQARQEAGSVLTEYRRLRGMNKRLTQESQRKQREFVQQKRTEAAKRLEALHETIARLEKSMQPQQKSHGYVWLLLGRVSGDDADRE